MNKTEKEELLMLREENEKLKARNYALSSQLISLEQDKIELREKLDAVRQLIHDYDK